MLYKDACVKLTERLKTYKDVIKDSSERRATFINNLAFAKANAGNIETTNALRQMDEDEV